MIESRFSNYVSEYAGDPPLPLAPSSCLAAMTALVEKIKKIN
jgi:hypothetical protein